jgi:hypothetical protein
MIDGTLKGCKKLRFLPVRFKGTDGILFGTELELKWNWIVAVPPEVTSRTVAAEATNR